MTSLRWWKKICRHCQRKESTCMACSWMALGGIDETAGSRSLPLKFCLLPFVWCTFMRLILPPWLRTSKITQTHWNFMSVLCTRSPDVLTWLTFSAWTWRLHSTWSLDSSRCGFAVWHQVMLRDIYQRPSWGGGGRGLKLCKTQPEGMAHVLNVFSAYLSSLIFGLPFKLWYGQWEKVCFVYFWCYNVKISYIFWYILKVW